MCRQWREYYTPLLAEVADMFGPLGVECGLSQLAEWRVCMLFIDPARLNLLVRLHYLQVQTRYLTLHAETLPQKSRCLRPLLFTPLERPRLSQVVGTQHLGGFGVPHVTIDHLECLSQVCKGLFNGGHYLYYCAFD